MGARHTRALPRANYTPGPDILIPWLPISSSGFLEALCRVAALKSMPTDDEIASAHEDDPYITDAASYLENLRETNADGYQEFLKERAAAWGKAPPQPIHRMLAHCMSLILRKMELARRNKSDWGKLRAAYGGKELDATTAGGPITAEDVGHWFRHARRDLLSHLGIKVASSSQDA